MLRWPCKQSQKRTAATCNTTWLLHCLAAAACNTSTNEESCNTTWLGSTLHTITIASTTQPELARKLMIIPKHPSVVAKWAQVLRHVGCNVSMAPLHTYVLCMCRQTGLDVTLTWCYAGLAHKHLTALPLQTSKPRYCWRVTPGPAALPCWQQQWQE